MKKSDKKYLNAITELGCIACRLEGRGGVKPEIHHPREGTGLALKAPHKMAIALCHKHHRGTDHPRVSSIHLAPNQFKSQYGTEAELWQITQDLLNKKPVEDEF